MKYYNDNDEDKSRSESDARDDGYIAVFVGSIITISIIAIFVYVFSSIDSNKSTLRPVENVEVSQPVQEVPKEPEITFADFEDFGITFDEFVQEYNNSSVGQEYPIKFFGLPTGVSDEEYNRIRRKMALKLNTTETYLLINSNTHYSTKGDVTEFLFDPVYDVTVFIKTKGESYNVFAITVLGSYYAKSSSYDWSRFYRTTQAQEKVFQSMSEILLKRMESRGVSPKVIAGAKLEVKKYSDLNISYGRGLLPYYHIHLGFSLKEGVYEVYN